MNTTTNAAAAELPCSEEEIRPGVPAGHFYRWPTEILGVVLNVRDDVVRLRELAAAGSPLMRDAIEQLATSLENGVAPAERFLQRTLPANIAGAGIELNRDTRTILGMTSDQCGVMARVFRAAGHNTGDKPEDQQAFVIHWMLGVYLKEGADWHAAVAEELSEAQAEASALINAAALPVEAGA